MQIFFGDIIISNVRGFFCFFFISTMADREVEKIRVFEASDSLELY